MAGEQATATIPTAAQAPVLGAAEATPQGLLVRWQGRDEPTFFPWFWLRDHGEDADSLDPATRQRRTDTFAIPADIRGVTCEIGDQGRKLVVAWSDGSPPSTHNAEQLARCAGILPADGAVAANLPRRLWSAGDLPATIPTEPYEAIVESEAGLRRWLEAIHVFGFAVAAGVPSSEAATRALAERIGYVRETIFGGLWTLRADVTDHADTAYSTQALAPHTDGTYSHDAPGLQMFNCLDFEGRGGESLLVDGFAIAEQIRAEEPDHFATLTRVAVPGRYVEAGVHLQARRPALRVDADGTVVQVSFNNYDRAPFLLPEAEMAAFYRAYGALNARVNDTGNWLRLPLRPGMALVFDNWRVLHGRAAYAGRREFAGCYVNREDFESRLRVLRHGA